MSLGIDCVTGTDFKLKRKQLICFSAGKHLEKKKHTMKNGKSLTKAFAATV